MKLFRFAVLYFLEIYPRYARKSPNQWLDPFEDRNNEADAIQEKRVLKKLKPSTDSFLTSTLPVDIKQPPLMNEPTSLKKLLQSAEPEVEPEKKNSSLLSGIPGFQKPKDPEIVIKTKKPNPPPMQQAANSHHTTTAASWGNTNANTNTLVEGNFLSNKLKYLPHVKSKESKYSNSIVPVLPSFLTEDL